MAEAVAQAIERPGHLMVEAGTGVGKSFAYLVPAILAAAEPKKKVVVSTHTISLQEQLLQKDIPFLRVGDAAGVLGRPGQGAVELHQPAAARRRRSRGRTRPFQQPEEFDQLAEIRLWAGRTERRQPLRPRLPPAAQRLGRRRRARTATAWAEVPDATRIASTSRPGGGCGTANLLVVNHALFVTDLALRGAGVGLLPDYDVAIFDEAHTLEAVAGEHLGLQVTSGQVEYLLARLYNDRTAQGPARLSRARTRRCDQVQRARFAADDFFDDVADWQARHAGRPTAGSASPLGWPDTLGEELRKLATAIGRGAESDRGGGAADRADRGRGALRGAGRTRSSSWLGQDVADERLLGRARGDGPAARITPGRAPRSTSARPSAATSSTGCRPAS